MVFGHILHTQQAKNCHPEEPGRRPGDEGSATVSVRSFGDKPLRMTMLCVFIAILNFGTAHAACSNPTGVEGEQIYNSTHKVMQYCDGADWTAMRSTGKADQSAVDALTTTVNGKINRAGDTMTGALTLNGAPIANNQAATKAYVDIVAASGSSNGGATVFKVQNGSCPSGYSAICVNNECYRTVFNGRILNRYSDSLYLCNGGANSYNCSSISGVSTSSHFYVCQKN